MFTRWKQEAYYQLKRIKRRKKVENRPKIFCIGRNKTGTTSLKRAFKDLGFLVGDQRKAERIYDKDYHYGNWDNLIEYCKSAEVFQDLPFTLFPVVPHIDKAYPGSKFILSIRDDTEQWYRSITRFHGKMFGQNGRVPTADDLRNATYIRKGFMYRAVITDLGTSEHDPYNKEILCARYEKHNADVLEYFKDRPGDLLVINVSDEEAYRKFVDFIGVDSPYDSFPWENKT